MALTPWSPRMSAAVRHADAQRIPRHKEHLIRATIYLGAATFAAALAIGTPALAGNHHDRNVVRLTAQTVQDEFVDVGSPGPTLGDQIVSSDLVFRHGEAVGTDGVICTIVKVAPDALTCNWVMTVALPGGQVTMQGIADGPTGPPTKPLSFELAVTGGTGQYRGAEGVARISDNPGGVEEIELRVS